MINLTDRERELIEQITRKKTQKEESPKKLSNSSSKILVGKLERKLNETLGEVDSQNTGHITYEQLGRVFTLLDIFQATSYNEECELQLQGYSNAIQKQMELNLHDKAWQLLAGEENQIDIQAAFCFFRIILDPNQLDSQKSTMLIKEYIEKIKGSNVEQDMILEFCREFSQFQKSRLAQAKTGYLKPNLAQNLIESYEKTLTFKPQLNPISEALQSSQKKMRDEESQSLFHQNLSQVSQSSDRIQELYRKKEITNRKLDFLKQEKEIREMQECTFKPTVISKKSLPNVVDRLYQVRDRKAIQEKVQQAQLKREEEEYSKCSFYPQLVSVGIPDMPTAEIKGFDRNVQRVRSALDKRTLYEKQLNHKPVGERYEIVKELPFSPPEMLSRNTNKKELPILYLDVKIGPSKVGRLAIRKSDDVEKVVKSFVKVWGVGSYEHQVLLEQVKQNLEKFTQEEENLE
ncbi:hypothetical protein pb186bvf_011693 [Paramecium bursaria]